ncbi:MAG: hypothetical protein Q7U04_08475 [Bacteriovorax sp.]|nr:hypothetical protein [Bacteriovorax sp.]
MGRDFSRSKWPEIKEMIKTNWDKLEEDEIDSLKGHLDLLSEKIQIKYSYSKEQADNEMLEFKKVLNPASFQHGHLPINNINL